MWITRDKDNKLFLSVEDIPEKSEIGNYWVGDLYETELSPQLFPEVKWEDTEPTEVELIIKKQ